MQPPPRKLDYAHAAPPNPDARIRARWRLQEGFLLGVLAMGIDWGVLLWGKGDLGTVVLAGLIVPAIVFVVGVTLLCITPTRALGGGILAALALGGLLLFITCAGRIR